MNRIAMVIGVALALTGCAASSSRPPEILSAGGLAYPAEAQDKKVEGYVRVTYDVSVDGSVTNVRVIDSNPPGVFDDAAVAAVRGWRFHPAISNGKPVVKELVSRVNFKLGESEGYAR
ncbi:MAG TPA: energy transducer TonB [Pseudomonadales bacterium]|jgi:protein TonB|nr:energy transducer TonB [Pseudomonadales bacterium]